MANEGFEEFFGQYEWSWKSAAEFRQRHLVKAMSETMANLIAAMMKQ